MVNIEYDLRASLRRFSSRDSFIKRTVAMKTRRMDILTFRIIKCLASGVFSGIGLGHRVEMTLRPLYLVPRWNYASTKN